MAADAKVGVYLCECGGNIGDVVDVEEIRKHVREWDHVVVARKDNYLCSKPAQDTILADIEKHSLERVVVASCTPRLHEPTFRKCVSDVGLNPYLLEMANIREQCSWVHLHDREAATAKAEDIVKIAVARARLLEPQVEMEVPVTKAALVIGGGVAGIQVALDLADAGHQVYLVEKEPSLGGKMAQLNKTFPTMDCSI